MAWKLVEQPDGLLAKWSDVIDDFTDKNMSEIEAYNLCRVEHGMMEESAANKIDRARKNPSRFAECMEIINFKKTKKTMNILEIQQKFKDNGFQWKEQIFNDGSVNDCFLDFSLSKNSHYFSNNVFGEISWGRFPRIVAWNKANDWLDKYLNDPFPIQTNE